VVWKKKLQELQKVSGVAEAQEWARTLVNREARGPGDTKNAMRRIEQRYGIDYSTLYSLRYRPPKEIFVSVYMRIRAAYMAECDRQQKLLKHERTITEAKGIVTSALVAASDALDREDDGGQC